MNSVKTLKNFVIKTFPYSEYKFRTHPCLQVNRGSDDCHFESKDFLPLLLSKILVLNLFMSWKKKFLLCWKKNHNFFQMEIIIQKYFVYLPSSSSRQCESEAGISINWHSNTNDSKSLWSDYLATHYRHASTIMVKKMIKYQFEHGFNLKIKIIRNHKKLISKPNNINRKHGVSFISTFYSLTEI